MGNNLLSKYNRQENVGITINLNKVCYYPGEKLIGNIIIIPKTCTLADIRKYSQITIIITEHSQYTYRRGSDLETEEEKIELIRQNFSLSDFIGFDEERQINFPIDYILPKTANPSLYMNSTDYVKHFISVEFPHFDSKRTNIFIVKNYLNDHSIGRTLSSPFYSQKSYNKKKFMSKKGSCQLIINMPRNYFLYNEKVSYNIHLDCKILQIPVKRISVTFYRHYKTHYRGDHNATRSSWRTKLYRKDYLMNKNDKIFDIKDFIYYIDNPPLDEQVYIYPIDIYKKFDSHGLYEVDDDTLKNLYPSCSVGLINIEYSLKVKVFFDSIFTSDEEVYVPIDFCDILYNNVSIENNMLNNKNIDYPEKKLIDNNIQANNFMSNNNINLINNNNNIINNESNNNIINNESAPPSSQITNMDKKNYLEDKDWVII